MKIFKKHSLFVLMVLVFSTALLSTSSIHYRPANPCPIVYTQPDGSQLTIYLRGDEHVRFARTVDDYTILQDAGGMYVYAARDAMGELVLSLVQANDPGNRRLREKRFLKKIEKQLFYSSGQLADFKLKREERGLSQTTSITGPFPATGTRKVLVLLIGFQDRPFSLPQADFDGLMNEPGFHGYGSFKEYHEHNSFDQLILNSTVMGPYLAANNEAYYGKNRGGWDARPRNMVAEAIDAAEAEGLDFSQFDNDGVTITDYITSPELSGISGSNISDIGVLVHEFGHNLGLPDTYDTDYEQGGGYAYGTGYYDVMADGGWNNGGFTPANHIAFAKYELGWQTPTVLNGLNTTITLPEAGNNNVSCLINTTTAGEYFIIENRQQVGWDEYIEGHGLLIYHIDGPYNASAGNAINANPNHQGIDIEEADNHEDWGESAAGDPFPGTTNNTSFTDTTTPNSKAWNNADTGVPISNISENGGQITFDVGSSGGTDMYVSDIAMTAHKQGKRYYARATVTVLGSPSGNPVANATVSITWSGVVSGSDSGTTNSNGTIMFTSAKIQNQTGPFTVTVNNVTHASIQYNSALNVETTDSVSY